MCAPLRSPHSELRHPHVLAGPPNWMPALTSLSVRVTRAHKGQRDATEIVGDGKPTDDLPTRSRRALASWSHCLLSACRRAFEEAGGLERPSLTPPPPHPGASAQVTDAIDNTHDRQRRTTLGTAKSGKNQMPESRPLANPPLPPKLRASKAFFVVQWRSQAWAAAK